MIRSNYWGVVVLSKVLSSATMAIVMSTSWLQAQNLASFGGPANLPPAGFSGQQFVDNRGCLFLRAGLGGTVNWVPRVDRARRPICGITPSFGAAAGVAAKAETTPVVNAVPFAAAGPAVVTRQFVVAAPVLAAASVLASASPAAAPRAAVMKTPAGYKPAWTDDRLNPLRGVGSVQGQAQQDQLWTRDIPAQLVADQPRARTTTRVATAARVAPKVTVSTMSAPQAKANAVYVQVGTFGQPANAAGVKARLAALDLPVSTSRITRSGKVLQIVYAGPFGSAVEARTALIAARNAGFGDAVLR